MIKCIIMETKAALVFLVRTVVNSHVHVEDKEISTGASMTEVIPTQALTVAFLPTDVDQSYKHWGDESDTY